ncbi:MAG TPA: FG-GAP-like repeat-containing protein [Gaiellales bacterium]
MYRRHTSIVLALIAALFVTSSADGATTVSDVASQVGLDAGVVKTWSSAPYDYNGDGQEDVLIVYHDRGATLWRNTGSTFVAAQQLPAEGLYPNGLIGNVDRHSCAWGDANRDGRPDVYCTVGRTGLNVIKSAEIDNELWLQGPNGTFSDAGTAWGVGDPYGRGRSATFIDANGDGFPDLYVANEAARPTDADHGASSENKLFLNVGGTGYRLDAANAYGLESVLGNGRRAITTDYNGDGWQDLLVTGSARPYLYRNDAGHGFTEVGASLGLTTRYADVALGDVSTDGRLDIVGVTSNTVYMQARTAMGYAAPVALATFPDGGLTSVAVGDVNGDERADVYAVRSGASSDLADALLVRNAAGWTRASLPATTGTGYDAQPLRTNGTRDDFLVLNGMPSPGTVQLIRDTSPQPRHRYITYMFGRAQVGNYVGGSNCRTALAGNVPLWTLAELIKSHGHTATAPVSLNQTGATAPVCQGTIRYATWPDLANLRDQYGWSVASRGRTGKELTTLTPQQQRDETCGTVGEFASHGFPEAWGMFAYPNNALTTDVQTSLVNACYGFGRRYSVGINPVPVPSPYWAKTNSVMGGRCNNAALPCYTLTVKNNRRYTDPRTLVGYENAAGWTIIQWYRFVTGKAGTIGSTTPAWDCTSPNAANHWTNEPEMYCYIDAHNVINLLAPGSIDTSPAAMAHMQGRLGR